VPQDSAQVTGTFLQEDENLGNGGSNTPNKTSYFGFRKSSTSMIDATKDNNEIGIVKQESFTSNDYASDNSPTFKDLGDITKKQVSSNY
jgi:hypothetical protein